MKYFLCNKCGSSILFVEEGKEPSGMCCEPMTVRTSGICGGGFTIELIPKKIPGVRTAFPIDDRIVVDLEETPLCFNCKKEPATRGFNKPKLCSMCWNSITHETNEDLEQS